MTFKKISKFQKVHVGIHELIKKKLGQWVFSETELEKHCGYVNTWQSREVCAPAHMHLSFIHVDFFGRGHSVLTI